MINRIFAVGVAAASLVAGMQGAAFAQDAAQAANCGCVVKGAQSAALGTIQSSTGRVIIAGVDGPRLAEAGQSIAAADRVATSVQSSAVVLTGGCQVALAGEQELSFQKQGENLCVAVNNVAGVTTTGQVQSDSTAGAGAFVLPATAAVIIGGAAIATATSDNDRQVSQ